MIPRQRVLNAVRCQEIDRVPWIPFVGCHAASLLGLSAETYFQNENHIVAGAAEAVRRYQPDGLPVTFDLQLEAEVLGCELIWANDNPPAVVSHPLANGTALEDLKIPGANEGRIQLVLQAARQIRNNHPDIALYGLITGPFTLALHLLGTDIFMKMFDDIDEVSRLMVFCRDVALAMSQYYIDAGCDIVAVVDPMTSQIGPDQFRQFVTPYITPIFQSIREQGALGSFFVCGHAEQNIKAMCECECDNISIDENIPLDYVRDICIERGISFGGNLQLTTVLLLGEPIDAQKNAIACLETGRGQGFLLAPGCDLPYATPPENLEAIVEIVHDPYRREVIARMDCSTEDEDRFDLSDYGQFSKVVVDVITLDSEACAPCQYMVDAVRKIAPQFEGIVEWREHKIKKKEALKFMSSLMVHNVPTICIDGQIKFVSRIPARDELVAAIQQRINEKFRMRLQSRKGCLYLFGHQKDSLAALDSHVRQAVTELAADVDIVTIEEDDKIRSFGILPEQTPAVVLARYQLKSTRRVPEVSIIREWLKDI